MRRVAPVLCRPAPRMDAPAWEPDVAQAAGKRAIRSAEIRRKAVDLRVAGASYEQIGEALSMNKATAWKHVQHALHETVRITAEAAERVRDIEIRRLDAQLVALWPSRSDPRASDTILRISDRRAKLLGLDAPEKHDVTVAALTEDERQTKVRALLAAGLARASEE